LVESVGLWVGQHSARAVRDDHVYLILIAALVGVTAGAAAGLLLLWIENATRLFESVEDQGKGLAIAVWLSLPVLGGLLVGLLRLWMTRRQRELPSVGTVMHVVAHPRSLDGRGAIGLGLGTGLTLGSGGSAGHEGPSVAIGAAVGSVVGRFLGLRMRRQMSMVGAGAAAGLAAAFNAPLSGVIFTVEILFRRSVGGSVGTMSVFLPLIVAAVTGTMTSHAIFGDRTEFVLPTQATYSAMEIPIYLLLAGLAALAAIATNRAILGTRRFFAQVSLPEWIKPALGGLLVGALAATTYSELLGSGRHLVADAVGGRLIWSDAASLGALKILATAFTLGSLGMGGVFMPSLFVGACLGALVAPLAEFLLPSASPTGAYALIGMAAMLGSMLRAPLTPVIMLFELTHDYGVIVPGMFVAILGSFIASRIDPRAYHEHMLIEEGKDLEDLNPQGEGAVMQRGRVGELMIEPDHLLRSGDTLEEVQRAALVEDEPILYVVDDEGKVVGLIDTARLAARVLRGEVQPGSGALELLDERRPELLVPDDTLAGAMLAMSRSRLAVLPVCDAERHLLGLLQRQDLIAHYAFNVLERQETQLEVRNPAGDHLEVGLGQGVILERVVVGRTWAGQTLAELDLRRQSGVQVVEWSRDEILVALDPHLPLREGDVLALMGDRKALLQARWLA
jgi:CIC family chloride channel protein